MPKLTDDQLAERVRGLGATDIATAAGVNPYQTPLELYLTKIGELDPDATLDDAARDRMERGHRLEDVALQWDRDLTGDGFVRVRRTIWHKTIPIIYCHPDAARDRKLTRLIEVKTSVRKWKEVPRQVEAQVQVQMACTGARAVDILVLGFDGPPKRFPVERDDHLIEALERLAVAFWDRVQRRDPPPMDGSGGAARWLNATRWADEPELRANDVQRRLLEQLVRVRSQITELEAEDSRLTNVIKDTMAGSARLTAPGLARVVWTAPFTVKTTQWKEVAAAYRTIIDRVGRLTPEVFLDTGAIIADNVVAGLDEIERTLTSEREQRTFKVERED